MKGCELCRHPARMYCESDGASLCWDCDAKVHSANFLVAKHSRCLLCHVCQSVTPWIASGTNLGRTISVCVTCHTNHVAVAQRRPRPDIDTSNNDDQDQGIGEDEQVTDSEGEYTSDSNYDEDEDGENQVVPWSCSPSPPPTAISMSSEDLSLSRLSSGGVSSLKRRRQDTDLNSEDDTGSSSSTCHGKDAPASQGDRSPRPLKLFWPEGVLDLSDA